MDKKEKQTVINKMVMNIYQDEITARVAAIEEGSGERFPNKPVLPSKEVLANNFSTVEFLVSNIVDIIDDYEVKDNLQFEERADLIALLGDLIYHIHLFTLRMGILPVELIRYIYDHQMKRFVSERQAKIEVANYEDRDYKQISGPLSYSNSNQYYVFNTSNGSVIQPKEMKRSDLDIYNLIP